MIIIMIMMLVLVWSMVKGDEDQQETIQSAENTLAYWKDQLEQKGLTCQTHLLIRGVEPGEDVVRFATDLGVEEIVIGVGYRAFVRLGLDTEILAVVDLHDRTALGQDIQNRFAARNQRCRAHGLFCQ